MKPNTSSKHPICRSDMNSSRNAEPSPNTQSDLQLVCEPGIEEDQPLPYAVPSALTACGRSAILLGLPKDLRGKSELEIIEDAHRSLWMAMGWAFAAAFASYFVLTTANDGHWIGAIVIAAPASWLWVKAMRRLSRCNRSLAYLEETNPLT